MKCKGEEGLPFWRERDGEMGPSEAKVHKGRRNSLHHCDVGKKAELDKAEL